MTLPASQQILHNADLNITNTYLKVSSNSHCSGSYSGVTSSITASVNTCYSAFGSYVKVTCSGSNQLAINSCTDSACTSCVSTSCAADQCCGLNSGYYGMTSGMTCSSGGGSGSSASDTTAWWNGDFTLQSRSGNSACMNDPNPCDLQCAQHYGATVSGNTLTLTSLSTTSQCPQCATLQGTFSDAYTAQASGSGYSATATRNTGNGATVVMSVNGAECTGVYAKSSANTSKQASFVVVLALMAASIALI